MLSYNDFCSVRGLSVSDAASKEEYSKYKQALYSSETMPDGKKPGKDGSKSIFG